jgi:hypothetical protein
VSLRVDEKTQLSRVRFCTAQHVASRRKEIARTGQEGTGSVLHCIQRRQVSFLSVSFCLFNEGPPSKNHSVYFYL